MILEKYHETIRFYRVRSVGLKMLGGECAPRMELPAEAAPAQRNVLLPEKVLGVRPGVLFRREGISYV